VKAVDITPGPVVSTESWEAIAAPAEHVQPYLDSLAYRFNTSNGSIVFTGDTQPCKSVTELARNADMMLCMCWDEQSIMENNGENVGQCGTEGAAKMAQEAEVKQLILVHIGPTLSKKTTEENSYHQIKKIYDGKVIYSHELMELQL
tara:strand:- start:76 stop:516 length:441 start_codon:yes stop_codon:yes gene_type:complete